MTKPIDFIILPPSKEIPEGTVGLLSKYDEERSYNQCLSDIIKLNTYYVYDGEEADAGPFWEAMTRVRMGYLKTPGPAATAVRVAGLAWPGQLIEVEALAYVREASGESGR